MNLIYSSVLSVFLLQQLSVTVTAWEDEQGYAALMSDSWTINPELVSDGTGAINMTSDEQGFAPEMFYNSNYGFDFNYNVTNFIQEGQASMAIYTSGCRSGGGMLLDTDGSSIMSGVNADGTTLGRNSGFKFNGVIVDVWPSLPLPVTDKSLIRPVSAITWRVALDPLNFADNTDIFTQESEKISRISFCLIFSLNVIGENGPEVNFQETEMVLNVDLQDPDASFNLDIDLAAKDKTSTATDVSYLPFAYVCTGTTGGSLTKTFLQGEVIDICLRPDAASQLQGGSGLVMNDVSFMQFSLLGDSSVQQAAIPNTLGLSEHTQSNCVNAPFCVVSTVLMANFYANTGSVIVNGMASLAFLGGPSRRRLNEGQRALQAGDVQPTAPVETIVGVTQMDDGPVMQIMAGGNTSTTISSIVMMGSVLMTMIASTLLI